MVCPYQTKQLAEHRKGLFHCSGRWLAALEFSVHCWRHMLLFLTDNIANVAVLHHALLDVVTDIHTVLPQVQIRDINVRFRKCVLGTFPFFDELRQPPQLCNRSWQLLHVSQGHHRPQMSWRYRALPRSSWHCTALRLATCLSGWALAAIDRVELATPALIIHCHRLDCCNEVVNLFAVTVCTLSQRNCAEDTPCSWCERVVGWGSWAQRCKRSYSWPHQKANERYFSFQSRARRRSSLSQLVGPSSLWYCCSTRRRSSLHSHVADETVDVLAATNFAFVNNEEYFLAVKTLLELLDFVCYQLVYMRGARATQTDIGLPEVRDESTDFAAYTAECLLTGRPQSTCSWSPSSNSKRRTV